MYERGGKYAETSRRVTEELLLKNQRPDGSWESPNESQSGTVYTTSLGVLSLTVKYHLLPIYQR